MKAIRFLSLLLVLSLTTACDAVTELTAPAVAPTVELNGPKYTYGTDRSVAAGGGFICEVVVIAKAYLAVPPSEDAGPEPYIEWTGGMLRLSDEQGQSIRSRGLTRAEVQGLLGSRMRAKQTLTSRPIRIQSDQLPFRWKLELTYIDSAVGATRSASVESRCISPE